jgi:hypothetical protein
MEILNQFNISGRWKRTINGQRYVLKLGSCNVYTPFTDNTNRSTTQMATSFSASTRLKCAHCSLNSWNE